MDWATYAGIVIAAAGGLLALRGETWDSSATSRVKLTPVGWSSLVVIVLGATVATISEYQSRKLSDLAASPVYSELSALATTAEQATFIKELAKDKDDPRSSKARELVEIDEFEWLVSSQCEDFRHVWHLWRTEADPRLRADLEMVSFFCEENQAARIELIRDASIQLRGRICDIAGHNRSCHPEPLKEIENRLNETLFAGVEALHE